MVTLAKYRIRNRLVSNSRFTYCGGIRTEDGDPVLLKIPNEENPAREIHLWLNQELEAGSVASLPGVLKPIEHAPLEQGQGLVFDFFDGSPLDKSVPFRFDTAVALTIGAGVARILARIHSEGFLHGALHPSAIWMNPAGFDIRLGDFLGIIPAVEGVDKREALWPAFPDLWPYLSPERTGRTRNEPDARSDLYSLGAVLYRCIAGRLPLEAGDGPGWINAHLAMEPVPLRILDPSVPAPVSDLIMRLLAKQPSARSRGAFQLAEELEECAARTDKSDWDGYAPSLGFATANRLFTGDRIWGREKEQSLLDLAFSRASGGSRQLVWVTADSGMGKTALLKDFVNRLPDAESLIGFGKCQYFRESTPFSGLLACLRDILDRLLLNNPGRRSEWKRHLSATLGPLSGPLASLLPELSWIMGPLPAVEPTEALEARNRMELALQTLLESLAEHAGCLVLVMDDVQWMDGDSARFLPDFAAKARGNFLLAVATRPGSTAPGPAAENLLSGCPKAGWGLLEMNLEPLRSGDIALILSHACMDRQESLTGPARILHEKTGGSPLFVMELLRMCLESGYLRPVARGSGWYFDLDAIRGLRVTDNVAEFLSGRVNALPVALSRALSAAACIGNSFESTRLRGLLFGAEAEPPDFGSMIAMAMKSGMLTAIAMPGGPGLPEPRRNGETLAFSHDRIRQACYELSGDGQLALWHRHLCDDLLEAHRRTADKNAFFEAVGHANRAFALDRSAGIAGIASLNRDAGKMSMENGSFSAGQRFFKAGTIGLQAQARSPWTDAYALSLELHELLAEAALTNGDFPEMERALAEIEVHARGITDTIRLHEIRILSLISRNSKPEALELARTFLMRLGVRLPGNPGKLHAVTGLARTMWAVSRRPMEGLLNGPGMRSPEALAAMRILRLIYAVAYLVSPDSFPLVVFQSIQLSLRYGNTDFSSTTFAAYGIILAGLLGKYATAYRFGELALRLEKLQRVPGSASAESKIIMAVNGFIMPWKRPWKEILPAFHEGFASGSVSGDLEYAGYNNNVYAQLAFHSGRGLRVLRRELERYQEFNRRAGHLRSRAEMDLYLEHVMALINGDGTRAGPPEPQLFLAQVRLGEPEEDRNLSFLYFLLKCIYAQLFEDLDGGLRFAREARLRIDAHFGYFAISLLVFHETLSLLAQARPLRLGERVRIRGGLGKMRNWAAHAPENFRHKLYLMEAESYRRSGRFERALSLYEEAVMAAQASDFPNEEAMALELSARFNLARGRSRLGMRLLRDCHQAYLRWGADAKAKQLENRYGYLFLAPAKGQEQAVSSGFPQASVNPDISSLLKASQAISGEMNLDRLAVRVMRVVAEYAAARYGCLVMARKDGTRWIESHQAPAGESPSPAPIALDRQVHFPAGLINYAYETGKTIDFGVGADPLFLKDPCFRGRSPKSVLCMPLLHQGKAQGVLYLENDLAESAFPPDCHWILNLLANQAAISIANANYHSLKLEAQQAKINPHFLFNALSSIANLASSDPFLTETAIVKLSNLYRYILTSSEKKSVTLRQEMEIVKTYLILEKVRFGAKLEYSVDLDERAEAIPLPGMLIQPLVENSIRHGISQKLGAGMVKIAARVVGDRCHISVEDDGDNGDEGKPGTGFGLRSVQERLELAFPGDHRIVIGKTPGFRVDIWIPAGNP